MQGVMLKVGSKEMRTSAAIRKARATRINPHAEITHLLSVGRHHSVQFSEQKVDEILAAASKVLHGAGCNVTLKRIGPLYTFASPSTPAIRKNQIERDEVHKVKFTPDGLISVKIVERIEFCRPNFGKTLFNELLVAASFPIDDRYRSPRAARSRTRVATRIWAPDRIVASTP